MFRYNLTVVNAYTYEPLVLLCFVGVVGLTTGSAELLEAADELDELDELG
ncbi:hypothetical protein [Lentilactobacillus kefiri]|nr:hypothetical protein [Lentilactobacillus kefiri]